jgi:hypothetical protein
MRFVEFDPRKLTSDPDKKWWAAWKKKSESATRDAIKAWEEDGKNLPRERHRSEVWGELKQWLLEHHFNKRCAYCQVSLERHDSDAEHFRPKGRVRVRNADDVLVEVEVSVGIRSESHPGYFWLAYTWQNLVPCCSECNGGKSDQFPTKSTHICEPQKDKTKNTDPGMAPYRSGLQKDHYYLLPAELEKAEGELLLNPLFDNPRLSITFRPKGCVAAKDERGTETIKVCRLDTEGLRGRRQKQQENLNRQFSMASGDSITPEEKLEKCRKVLASYLVGNEDFSEAALDFLDAMTGEDVRLKYV